MRYRETEPCGALRAYVRCYWELEGHTLGAQTILPDGCPEMVFHIGEPMRREGIVQPRAMFVGQMPGPVQVESAGGVHCFGIRFEPTGAWSLFRFRQSDFFGSIVPHPSWLRIDARIRSADSLAERVTVVEHALLALLPDVADPWCEAVSKVLAGAIPIAEIRQGSGVGIRQFERMFLTRVGMTPRLFARLARFRQALAMKGEWADIAAACGYYDQSHLIRDFRCFAGTAPSSFRADLMSQSSNPKSDGTV